MRILMIGAHQDDNEFRCGGLAKKYVDMGYEVRVLSLCNGCGGHHIMTPEETTAHVPRVGLSTMDSQLPAMLVLMAKLSKLISGLV